MQDLLIDRERNQTLETKIPFSSVRKIMTVAYKSRDNPDVVKIVVKGAPEYIIPKCTKELDSNNEI